MRICRDITEPHRGNLSWPDRWEGPDGGLIACWERGREKAEEEPQLARRAFAGELVMLPWRGGVNKATKGDKYGSLFYLAMYQGLRGESLDIETDAETVLKCARFNIFVTYTSDNGKCLGLADQAL